MSVRILTGDCREILATLPDQSVQCCVTSPPYFGLRDYGTAQWDGGDPACDHIQKRARGDSGRLSTDVRVGINPTPVETSMHYRSTCGKCGAVRVDKQMGLESTLAEYIAGMVAVFREVRRVLRNDGTLWLNIGDSYTGGHIGNLGRNDGGRNLTGGGGNKIGSGNPGQQGTIRKSSGLKPKDLMMVPARLAIALQDDGWYLRSDIIWHKPNPMPESVTDRPTSAHEHIFLLTKRARYYWDADAIREESTSDDREYRGDRSKPITAFPGNPQSFSTGRSGFGVTPAGRNARNVWTISTAPFTGAHFAVFPPEIPRRCILAGTSEKGQCPACGKPWVRVTEMGQPSKETTRGQQSWTAVTGQRDSNGGLPYREMITTGWQPSCQCDAGDPIPQTVLDPFAGAGTTGLVADQLGRNAILIELNPTYAAMASKRITNDSPMFTEVLA